MDRVLDRLYIGSSDDIDRAPLAALGFSAVLDLREGEHRAPAGVDVYRLTNRDGDPWGAEHVDMALAFVGRGIRQGRVLVACVAGISRSAAMVVGYLVRCGWDAPSALEHVRRARPRVEPKAEMLAAALAGRHDAL